LERTYYYFHRVYIVHLTFLPFAGESLDEADTRKDLESLATEALRAVHQEGVMHQDVRRENMLFCREVRSVMVIDFERALLVERPRVGVRKRKWEEVMARGQKRREFKENIVMAQLVCRKIC
ncbi:hypothetical protein IWW34DRAFT_619517, partial [Fusarium oxysporum f. sp. albedinis]